jgi:hypothetical protein
MTIKFPFTVPHLYVGINTESFSPPRRPLIKNNLSERLHIYHRHDRPSSITAAAALLPLPPPLQYHPRLNHSAMASHLLALITPRCSPAAATEERPTEEQRSSVRGTMIDDNHDDDDLQSDDDDSIVDLWQSYSSNGFGFLGKLSTEFMGWRCLTPNELMYLDVGSFFLLSIPSYSRYEDKDVIKLRAAFTKRLKEAVICCKRKEFPDNGKSVELGAMDYLYQHNGFIRNGCQYIEIACVVKAYPHPEEYICVMTVIQL